MRRLALLSLLNVWTFLCCAAAQEGGIGDRPWEDDVIYFLLPDRFANGESSNDEGGLSGGPLETGYDPGHKGFFHGGDLAGLTGKLSYLEELGVTAVWLGPIYRNKPVQGASGAETAGYHGYWITDFLDVDPHFGTRDDLRRFVEAAHDKGMKVILDIITNHTADVIAYRECHDPDTADAAERGDCRYRSEAAYPMTTRGTPDGDRINAGFTGMDSASTDGWAALQRADWAYTPFLPAGEDGVKNPAWLNDPIYYHNRGNFDGPGESHLNGDFAGLDDLMTEHPVVVDGMIDIYASWVEDFGVDGFRIDTARHVRPGFWQEFLPAIAARAEAAGKPDFLMFGEVYDIDPAALARHTRDDGFSSVLDFGFQGAVRAVIADGEGTRRLARLFEADVLYEEGPAAARRLPTFLGNHDMGRFSQFLREADPEMGEAEMIERIQLAHVLLLTARGVPTLYAGSEQGFVSDGGDQSAREDMFPSRTAVYNDNDLLATDATTADDNFDPEHPLFRSISDLVALRKAHPALRSGRQVTRLAEGEGGLFAFSRLGDDGTEILIVINAEDRPREGFVTVEPGSRRFEALHGSCASEVAAQASFRVSLPPRSAVVCRSQS